MIRRNILIATIIYSMISLIMLTQTAWYEQQPESDGKAYHLAGIQIQKNGFYSLDGEHPLLTREPGMSIFLSGIYSLFDEHNHMIVFYIQTIMVWGACIFFLKQWRVKEDAVAQATLFLFAVAMPIIRMNGTFFRESLSLSILLLFTGMIFSTERNNALWKAVLTGLILGYGMLTLTSLLLLPVIIILLPLFRPSLQWKSIAIIVCSAYSIVGIWGIRNMHYTGSPCLTGCYRSALQWYVRGERSENMHSISEPYLCLWSEYVSRDWNNRSDYCSFNGVWHKKWPNGFIGVPEDTLIANEGMQKILKHPRWYILDSISEIVELHLPFVGPWGKKWNILITLYTAILYIGIAIGIRKIWKKEYALFLLMICYFTGIYILTDATPRYLLPILFCYIVCSAIGYTHLISTILPLWKKSASSFLHTMKKTLLQMSSSQSNRSR